MGLNAGRLRHRVLIQTRISTPDEYGDGTVTSWTDLATVWAEVSDYGGRELVASGAPMAETTTRITFRFLAGVDESSRIVHDGRAYDIQRLERDPTHREFLVAFCREGVSGG
jgi:SPP1 family predicted phage head-tail adaptor